MKIEVETFDEEVTELCKEFSEIVKPSEKSAKFAEKLFSIIGKMQGQLKGLENLLSQNQTKESGK